MIGDFLINILYEAIFKVTQLIANFGDVSPDNNITSSIVAIKTFYVALSPFWPLAVLTAIPVFDFVLEGAVLSYKFLRWAYSKIPGIN